MENNVLIPIGKRIGEIRRAHNFTQEALAEKLEVSPKHISHTERGTSSLSLKNLIEFCNLFNCSLDYIIFGERDDSVIAKMPKGIIDILRMGNEAEIECLNNYLQMYIELRKK